MRLSIALFLIALTARTSAGEYLPRDGDIIFQTSQSSQSQAIQLATRSPYSHVGIVYLNNGEPYVFEAVQPVKSTPLAAWISQGEGGKYVVKRLRDSERQLTPERLEAMKAVGEQMRGLDYDPYFEWSDERIYCSELVWKVYKLGAGIEVGQLERIDSFDLTHELVRAKIRERFPNGIPADEIVISPAAIFEANNPIAAYEQD